MSKEKQRAVRYKVTGYFGDLDLGDVVEAFVLLEDESTGVALLYHPPAGNTQYYAGSVDFAKKDGRNNYKSLDNNAYVNLSVRASRKLEKMFGLGYCDERLFSQSNPSSKLENRPCQKNKNNQS